MNTTNSYNHAEFETLWDSFLNKPIHKFRKKAFIKDGVIDPNKWNGTDNKIKVLFFNKEAHWNSKTTEQIDLREVIRDNWKGPYYPMWRRMAEIAWLLHSFQHNAFVNFRTLTESDKSNALLESAFLNIKKSDGSNSSEQSDLKNYWDSDFKEIINQMQIINPNFIVLGGIIEIVKTEMKLVQNDMEGYFYSSPLLPNAEIINYWHPAYQVPADMYFYTLAYHLYENLQAGNKI